MQNLSNQSIGNYRVGNLVAAGTFATFYELPDNLEPETNRKLIMKVFPASLDEDASYRRRFDDVLQRVAQLDHSHLMPIYDYGIDTDTGLSFVIIPYFENRTLAERIAVELTISRRDALAMLRGLAEALDEAHVQGFVHRDVKPSNIFFDDQGSVVLADLGLAGILQETFSLIGIQQRIGSPAFLAPELWRGQVATPQSDVYALGILAYQLFAGKLPFEASTIGAVEYQHLNEIPLPPSKHQPDLSKDVDAVFERVFAKQSAQRFQTASLFIKALAIALEHALDVETSVQPALKVDAPLSRPLLSSSETLVDNEESIDQADEALVIDTDIPASRSPLLKWIRRVGCLAMIVVWMALMLSPCLLLTVIVRGEATLPLSDKPGHQLRMFKIFDDDVRGFGFSWGSVEEGDADKEVCIKSHVRYFTWQGSGENVDFCQCYTKVDDDWVAGTSVDNMCNPSQN